MKNSPPKVAPFRALRYSREKVSDAAQVIAPPYDVISAELQKSLYERNSYNVIRLELGQERSVDTPDDNRYTRTAHDFARWIQDGILVRDPEPAFYLYQQEFVTEGGRRWKRSGFFGLKRLEEFGSAVRPHETTLEGPKRDRLRLMQSCQANLSPIFMIYPDSRREVVSCLEPYYEREPLVDIVDRDSVCHRLWQVKDPEVLRAVSSKMEQKGFLIADGHHRYEVGLAYQREMLKKYPNISASAPFNYILTYFNEMDDPGLVIFPTHRVVTMPRFPDPLKFMARIREEFVIESFHSKNRPEFLHALQELKGGGFGLFLSKDPKYHLATFERGQGDLDVVRVHETVLRKILGFTEQDERDPEKISYLKETAQVFQSVEDSAEKIGLLLNAPRTDEVVRAAERGIILPPKSTYFYPKLVTGLVFHWIRPEEVVSI